MSLKDEMNDETRVGAAHRGGSMDPTHGFQALQPTPTPLDSLIEKEEGRPETDAVRSATMRKLMAFIFDDGKPENPEFAMRRLYAIAKAFYPDLIEGISLEALGKVFEEDNTEKGRQRWSARIRNIINKPIAEAGGVAHAKFQKSETTCRKYSEAQKGNQNRKKKK
jgi:hypothetical protein